MFTTIYCKVVFTEKTTTFIIPNSVSLRFMIQLIKETALTKFELQNIEVVEAGQDFRPAELANALVPEDITLFQKYGTKETLSFYIRPIVHESRELEPSCVICQENEDIRTLCYYNCSHLLCEDCIVGSVRNGLTRCSICRSPPRHASSGLTRNICI